MKPSTQARDRLHLEMKPVNMKRRLLHYIIGLVLLTIYGGQVCPFLESLTLFQLVFPILAVFSVQFLVLHLWLEPGISARPFQRQSRLFFVSELTAFIVGGISVTIFNTIVYGFPLGSGAKLLLAMGLMGFFGAVDISLFHEWHLGRFFEARGINISPEERFLSQPKKLLLFASCSAIFLVGIVFLVINKDLEWLMKVGDEIPVLWAQQLVLLELGFVVLVLLGYTFNLIYSYSRNLSYFLEKETSVLIKATDGDFETFVPISTSDEFGIMAKHTNIMVAGLKARTEELQKTQDITILSLASLAETRDNETGNHILRTQRYVKALAERLQTDPDFASELSDEAITLLFKSAPLHDIGKVGIPDHILLKPGKLDDDEFRVMKRHPFLGGEALKVAEEKLGSTSFLTLAREIAMTHHEKWDGTGYPRQLKGDDIPLSGRLMAVADVYDALISKRVYKPAFTHEKAKQIIVDWRGINFDPRVVDAFLAEEEQFIRIAAEFKDKQ